MAKRLYSPIPTVSRGPHLYQASWVKREAQELASRASLAVPGRQEELLEEAETGKPVT